MRRVAILKPTGRSNETAVYKKCTTIIKPIVVRTLHNNIILRTAVRDKIYTYIRCVLKNNENF